MAINTLTDLANDIQVAKQIVGRERIGGIGAVTVNSDGVTRAAKDDIIRSLYAPEPVVNTAYAPSMTIPEGDAQVFTNQTMTLDNYINVQIPWDGEEQLHMDNGAGYETARGLQIEQAFRKLANQVELDFMNQLALDSGNAVGVAGSDPFASDIDAIADAMKELDDRGAPMDAGALSCVMGNAELASLRKLNVLLQADTAGTDELLRRGIVGDLYGALLRPSAQVATVAAGTEDGNYETNGAASEGALVVAVDTGTGTILEGQTISFASGDHEYVVADDFAGGAGNINLVSALLEDIPDGDAITVSNAHRANLLIHRGAAELAFRPIMVPRNGDAALERMTVRDEVSGLVFEMALYQGYYKTMLDISVLYGYKVWNPDFSCKIKG